MMLILMTIKATAVRSSFKFGHKIDFSVTTDTNKFILLILLVLLIYTDLLRNYCRLLLFLVDRMCNLIVCSINNLHLSSSFFVSRAGTLRNADGFAFCNWTLSCVRVKILLFSVMLR